ncbi:hypothetical protein [Nannocystis sp. SCPEA4]|uniref:hypothetical protein n=1 Tax=Nannocystis sp. SCPEA4 TaxID=2996787 RepID=UPI0022711402|nr:hypothetical protein [Nannocystis sp. SCPEA4]MCY1059604.1 hypothetical protein [Nannocystis sp. SCPEA4]
MKIIFWNTQRSADLAHYHANWPGGNFLLACEILIDSQLKVSRQSPSKNRAQLGYRIIAPFTGLYLDEWEVNDFDELTGFPIWISGGNSFKKQSKRQVAQVLPTGSTRLDINLFIFHANSSDRAPTIMSWVICDLAINLNDFVLLGDFNCEPLELMKALVYVYKVTQDSNLKDSLKGVRVTFAGHTHNAKTAANKTLDYMVSKGVNLLLKVHNNVNDSDHYPIEASDPGFLVFNAVYRTMITSTYFNWSWSGVWNRVYNSGGCEVWEFEG